MTLNTTLTKADLKHRLQTDCSPFLRHSNKLLHPIYRGIQHPDSHVTSIKDGKFEAKLIHRYVPNDRPPRDMDQVTNMVVNDSFNANAFPFARNNCVFGTTLLVDAFNYVHKQARAVGLLLPIGPYEIVAAPNIHDLYGEISHNPKLIRLLNSGNRQEIVDNFTSTAGYRNYGPHIPEQYCELMVGTCKEYYVLLPVSDESVIQFHQNIRSIFS